MREIEALEANDNFESVLEAVERGETFLILRDGRLIARFSRELESKAGIEPRQPVENTDLPEG